MIKKYERFALKNRLRVFLQQVYLWDTTVSLYIVLKILTSKLVQIDIDQRASSVAYSFVLAVFPSIIFIFTLIPYIPIRHIDLQIMNMLAQVMPQELYKVAQVTITEIVSKPRGDILSLGFIIALYASTSGMMSLMRAFNMSNKSKENRSFIKSRLIALLLTFLLASVLVIAIATLIVGRIIADLMLEEGFLSANLTYYSLNIITYLVVFALFLISISIIYFFAPAIQRRWRFFNIGSIISSILIILITNLFSYYLSNFASYNKVYGSIGTLIALMIWLYLIALILILGFDINISLREAKSDLKR
jgi:membrane protein